MPLYKPASTEAEREAQTLAAQQSGPQYSLRVYRALERDLLEFERHVPLEEEHLQVYSLELWSIMVRACAEIDSQLHSILVELGLAGRQTNVTNYRAAESQLQLSGFQFTTIPGRLTVVPFKAFSASPPATPRWWQDYNSVKHNRLASIKSATFENSISAVAGVAAVLYRQWGDDLFPRALYLGKGAGFRAPFPSSLFVLDTIPWQ